MESRLRSTARHAPAAFAASVEEPRSRRLFCGPPPCRLLPQRKDAIPERRFASCANLKYSVQITYGRGGGISTPGKRKGGTNPGSQQCSTLQHPLARRTGCCLSISCNVAAGERNSND